MTTLVIDTSTSALNIALLRGGTLFEVFFDFGLHHTEHLAQETEKLLLRGETRAEELDLLGCTSGPGSFTGLRIGLSFAKGFAFGASIPLVLVPTLDLYAYGNNFFQGTVFPVIDARKKRIYTAAYENGKRSSEYLDIPPERLTEFLPKDKRVLLTGPYAPNVYDTLKSTQAETFLPLLDPTAGYPRGKALAELALQSYNTDGGDADTAGPSYIRPSEAELSTLTSRGKAAHE
ncbi:MAG: tRNA (adenosine(37)-N6)-threonylcarbamoyltransferase complex dimerization subunit type 1 TsaB [Spirochaetia bacterium]